MALTLRALITLLLVQLSLDAIATENSWRFQKQEQGVSIYTKPVLHSSVNAFKAHVILNGSLETIARIILDYPKYPVWYEDYLYGEIIERISTREFMVRFVIGLPYRFKDRDSVNRVVVTESIDQVEINLTSAPEFLESQKGNVRMRVSSGHWVLRKTQPGKIEIELTYHADPELGVPRWLANRFVIDGPIH